MLIYLNGEQREIPEQLSMSELIALLDLADRRLAVEVNEELVPRSRFTDHRLGPGDRIEIVHAIGGG
ncbi:MAG: sulfur carrier protein ThiS [Chromatiales bacterium]|jgi:sulfur carrier protein